MFFQLSLSKICARNAIKLATELINWAMVGNHVIMDANMILPKSHYLNICIYDDYKLRYYQLTKS
jgi:hypothetical protein